MNDYFYVVNYAGQQGRWNVAHKEYLYMYCTYLRDSVCIMGLYVSVHRFRSTGNGVILIQALHPTALYCTYVLARLST